MLQVVVIGEDQQSFAVRIEAARRVDVSGKGAEVGKSGFTGLLAELRKNTVGFMAGEHFSGLLHFISEQSIFGA
jgi:hypothetical protein